ncbi:MAG: hypothetical protein ACK48K_13685, partial [Planctomycetota bacterium]
GKIVRETSATGGDGPKSAGGLEIGIESCTIIGRSRKSTPGSSPGVDRAIGSDWDIRIVCREGKV